MRIEIMRGVKKLVEECLNVQPGENVLIVSDTLTSDIGKALAFGAYAQGAEVVICTMTPRTRTGEEPPKIIAEAMKAADAVLLPVVFSLTHTRAMKDAIEAGARILSLPGISEATLMGGGLQADFLSIKPLVEKVAKLLAQANTATLTSLLGTNIRMKLKKVSPIKQYGIAHTPGSWVAPPAIEVAIAPEEETTEGILVIDGITVPYVGALPGGRIRKPIKFTFKKGKIVDIQGQDEARTFKEKLDSYGDPNVYCAVELGVGLNPKARMGGGAGPCEDEVQYGTLHIGIGEGKVFGSGISASAHCDLVFTRGTLELDRQTVIKDGKLLIEGAEILE